MKKLLILSMLALTFGPLASSQVLKNAWAIVPDNGETPSAETLEVDNVSVPPSVDGADENPPAAEEVEAENPCGFPNLFEIEADPVPVNPCEDNQANDAPAADNQGSQDAVETDDEPCGVIFNFLNLPQDAVAIHPCSNIDDLNAPTADNEIGEQDVVEEPCGFPNLFNIHASQTPLAIKINPCVLGNSESVNAPAADNPDQPESEEVEEPCGFPNLLNIHSIHTPQAIKLNPCSPTDTEDLIGPVADDEPIVDPEQPCGFPNLLNIHSIQTPQAIKINPCVLGGDDDVNAPAADNPDEPAIDPDGEGGGGSGGGSGSGGNGGGGGGGGFIPTNVTTTTTTNSGTDNTTTTDQEVLGEQLFGDNNQSDSIEQQVLGEQSVAGAGEESPAFPKTGASASDQALNLLYALFLTSLVGGIALTKRQVVVGSRLK